MQKSSNIKNNEFLSGLADHDFQALQSHLKPAKLVRETVLFDVGGVIPRIYFPTTELSPSLSRWKTAARLKRE
jgi:hypothetical protein